MSDVEVKLPPLTRKEWIKGFPVKDLIPYEKNPKIHDEAQVDKIIASMMRNGINDPIEINEENVMLCGHGRKQALDKMGIQTVDVLRISGMTPEQQNAYRIENNKTAEDSKWDFDFLLDGFSKEQLFDFGFKTKEMPKGEIVEDEAPGIPEMPKSQTGDIYQLGMHKIICGDATSVEDMGKLMDGKQSAMINTDPPYNVDYGVSKKTRHKIRSIENDKQSPEDWEIFCKALYENFRLFNTGDIYMWGAPGPEGMKMRLWLIEAGCHWSATIIWKPETLYSKDRLVLTPANYQRMYEACFYGWFDKSSFIADRKETEVWDIKRPGDSKLHNTMKPIELCAKAINNSSNPLDIVLDPFLGSGSTLIACEQCGRVCFGSEISPAYIDVILLRYINYKISKNEEIIIKKNGAEIDYRLLM